MLSREQAKVFYDRFGAKQDSQAFYEDRATADLVLHAGLDEAGSVFEFGCGTGRFAEGLLEHTLPITAQYHGVDLSATMVGLARERLKRFNDRARVDETGGSLELDAPDNSADRMISNFVLDILSEEDIAIFLGEARRVLLENGRLCLVSLTPGRTLLPGIVTGIWNALYRLRPTLVGGCRPIELLSHLPESEWKILYSHVVVAYGLPAEVVIASPATAKAKSGYGQVA